MRGQPQRRHQRLGQLEGNTGPAEVVGVRGIVIPLGVDDGKRRGKLLSGEVVR